jgi:hypothetical protein
MVALEQSYESPRPQFPLGQRKHNVRRHVLALALDKRINVQRRIAALHEMQTLIDKEIACLEAGIGA